jgi:TonB-dependent receptor
MPRQFITLVTLLLVISFKAQTGRISGTILDAKTGETLPGATILIEGTTKGAAADFDGKFSINNVPVGKVTLVASYVSYSSKKIGQVNVVANDVTDVNVMLEPASSTSLTEVEVVVTLNKENNTALVLQQKNNASVSDGISAETIKRTPDRNTGDVLKRVSGASIQDNKFAIVRGLNERYNAAYLNGAPLPSSESDRKAFAFDIFPANMLDNLVITKTARPDLPGEFAGGIIDITTKSIPEKNFFLVSVQGGYNPITTGKQQYYYKGGKTDWLGIDDGTRAMPAQMPDIDKFPTTNTDKAKLAKDFPTSDWGLYSKKFAPNAAFQASAGYNFKRKERDFIGLIAALSYNRNNNFYDVQRNTFSENTVPNVPSQHDAVFTDKIYSTQTLAGALLNLTVKISPNHSISSKNLYSINADDRTTVRTGTANLQDVQKSFNRSYNYWFTGNKISSSQLIGEHYFEKSKLKFSWVGSYSGVVRDVPNLRRNAYGRNDDPTDTTYKLVLSPSSVGNDYAGFMFWSKLNESLKSFKADVTRQFKVSKDFNLDAKVGGLIQSRQRTFAARQVGYTTYNNVYGFLDSLSTLPPSQAYSPQNMGALSGELANFGGFKLTEGTRPTDSYTASAILQAGYLMADVRYKEWFRAVIGARVESYNQKLIYPGKFFIIDKTLVTRDTTVTDILPSANLVFSPNAKQNIRLSASKTLNRPEFRELAKFGFYDFNTFFFTSGNDALQRATIMNYDLRYEIFPGRGQLFSVSGFYKNFTNPIEQVASLNINEITYANAPKANCYGAEVEYRIILGQFHKKDSSIVGKFLDNLTFFTNFALIKSVVDVSNQPRPDGAPTTRRMQGQSPYLLNAGLSYIDNENGWSLSAIVNRVGQRIAVVGNYYTQLDIWENGRTVLDLQASKSFLKNRLEIRVTARDLLAKTQFQYLYNDKDGDKKFNKDKDDILRKVRLGTAYALQITYRF